MLCHSDTRMFNWIAKQWLIPRPLLLHAVSELPTRPIRNSWGDDDEDVEEEIPDEEVVPADDEDPDPFDDFDEEDFDDDFDDDFEEELDDEYEIEPKDDGFVIGTDDPDLEPDEEDID